MSAVISECGTYRYRLERGRGRTLAVIMVNPSTADAENDDPTIRKVLGFADRLNCGRIIVGNKFAFRATDINELRKARDPVGPENDHHIEQILCEGDLHVVAWGSLNKLPDSLRDRWKEIVRIADRLGVDLNCIGTNADKHPKHPLMTAYTTAMAPWMAPWFAGRSPSVTQSNRTGVDRIDVMTPEELENWTDDGNCNAGRAAVTRPDEKAAE
jgi:hypothetical protein